MTLDTAGLKDIGAIATTFSSAISPVAGYVAKERAADAAMSAAQEEARLMRESAEDAALKERQAAKKVRSAQLAAYLSSGVTLEGSPLLVADETTAEANKATNTLIKNSMSKERALINKAKSVERGDLFGTFSTTLSGVGKGLEYFTKK